MNRIVTLAFKDLAVLAREKEALFWIFLFPLIFALFFGFLSGGGGGERGKLQQSATTDPCHKVLRYHLSLRRTSHFSSEVIISSQVTTPPR